ncbi:MAG: hypothetical protein Q7S01_04730 [bacterium]|nr:hypothetical protein [bacterium]
METVKAQTVKQNECITIEIIKVFFRIEKASSLCYVYGSGRDVIFFGESIKEESSVHILFAGKREKVSGIFCWKRKGKKRCQEPFVDMV